VRRTGASRDVPNSTARRPSRRRFGAHCERARSSAPAFRRDRASPTPSPVARTCLDSPSDERARTSVEPPPARVVAKFVALARALVNTDADGVQLFPRIPLTRSPTSRAQVHTANHVARRHARSWLCEHCHNGGGTVRAGSPERGERETHLAGLGQTLTFNPIRAPPTGGLTERFPRVATREPKPNTGFPERRFLSRAFFF